MLFRKLLTGAVITDIRQQGLDRILYIDLNGSNEIGDRVKYTLVIEIMAQYSNCILLDEANVIIDSLKRVDMSKSSYREVLPQRTYVLPPAQEKLNLLEISAETAIERIRSFHNKTLSSAILNALSGVSPTLSKELSYRVCLGDKQTDDLNELQICRLIQELNELKNILISGQAKPAYLSDRNGELLEFSFIPLTFMANDARINPCDSLSALLDVFYAEREKKQRAHAQAEDIFRLVNGLIERTTRKINVRRAEMPDESEIEEKRICAELINVNIAFLPKGVTVYEIPNYYDGNRIKRIKAHPELTPQKNAQKYYKEYRKAQTAKKVLAEQIEKALAELAYLQTVLDELSRAETYVELSEIREELRQTGFLKTVNPGKSKKSAALPPFTFTTPDGFRVLVGRNNLQNDRLSFKTAKKTDLWFHVQKAPGSHVILCLDGGEPTDASCEFAAGLAVWFSSVRERGKAEVDYTQIKNLKKPPASAPGYVIYHVYNTVYAQAINPKNLKEEQTE